MIVTEKETGIETEQETIQHIVHAPKDVNGLGLRTGHEAHAQATDWGRDTMTGKTRILQTLRHLRTTPHANLLLPDLQ